MKAERQIQQEDLENVRKILITVADLCLTSDRTSSLHALAHAQAGHEEYLTVRQIADRIGYREQGVRNMLCAAAFTRGVHYYKRRGRVLFVWETPRQAALDAHAGIGIRRINGSARATAESGSRYLSATITAHVSSRAPSAPGPKMLVGKTGEKGDNAGEAAESQTSDSKGPSSARLRP